MKLNGNDLYLLDNPAAAIDDICRKAHVYHFQFLGHNVNITGDSYPKKLKVLQDGAIFYEGEGKRIVEHIERLDLKERWPEVVKELLEWVERLPGNHHLTVADAVQAIEVAMGPIFAEACAGLVGRVRTPDGTIRAIDT